MHARGSIVFNRDKGWIMKFLANENIPIASVNLLRKAGYDTGYFGRLTRGGKLGTEVRGRRLKV